MKTSRLGAVVRLFFIVIHSDKLVTVNTSPTCNWDQITRLSGSNESCWDCPKCPKGLGLTPQCSSYVSFEVQIHCEGCKKGVTYSDVNDISSCKPCTICGDNEITIRECNITHNAICGKCKPGFYRSITEDCWPCTKCCPDSTSDELEPQCINQGLPTKLSCRLDFKTQACAKKSTPKPSHEDVRRGNHRNDSVDGRVGRNGTVIVRYHIITKIDQNIWIYIGVGVFLCLLAGVTVYTAKYCRSRKTPLIHGQQEMGYDSSARPTDV